MLDQKSYKEKKSSKKVRSNAFMAEIGKNETRSQALQKAFVPLLYGGDVTY